MVKLKDYCVKEIPIQVWAELPQLGSKPLNSGHLQGADGCSA